MTNFDRTVDVLVVGSGAAGMITAWTAARLNLDAIVVEKAEVYGGNTALSGGGAWLPNAPYFLSRGVRDDPEALLAYLRALAPEVAPERHRTYVREAPRVAAALEATKPFRDGFQWIRGWSDYYPDKGGAPEGRGLWPTPLSEEKLGPDAKKYRSKGKGRLPGAPKGMWLTSADYHQLISLRWGGLRGPLMLLRLGYRSLVAQLTGKKTLTNGVALAARLRTLLEEAEVPVWLNSPMRSLIRDEAGRVTGAVVERDGKQLNIGARNGVMLAAGGFEGSAELRGEYQPFLEPGLTGGSMDNVGDGIVAGKAVGAALDLMDDAWWMPGMKIPGGTTQLMSERSYPHQFVVNGDGKRFVNEASPYTEFGHAMIAGEKTGVGHFPSYMIFDHFAWQHYFFGGLPNRKLPQDWLDLGTMVTAGSLEELAEKIGVPIDNLLATAERFNAFARAGKDEDFHRGESVYDHWYGNPSYPNPNLGEVKEPPFYALKMVLSDLGTKGGLLTDENARVLSGEGDVIVGLYAAGNNSAAVMGHSYAGPGATIGSAMTFGWVAAHHMAEAQYRRQLD